MLPGPQRLGEIFVAGVYPVRTELGTQTAGDTPAISPDGVFANGIAKPRGSHHNFWEGNFFFSSAHRSAKAPLLFFHQTAVQSFPSPSLQTTLNDRPHLAASALH